MFFNSYPQPYPENLGFIDAVTICVRRAIDFNGRSPRAEFWWWTLACFLVNLTLTFTIGLIPIIGPFFTYLVSLALIVPSLAVAWRRMHDIGKAGPWCLVGYVGGVVMFIIGSLISFAGAAADLPILAIVGVLFILAGIAAYVIYIVWCAKEGERATNQFGLNPYGYM